MTAAAMIWFTSKGCQRTQEVTSNNVLCRSREAHPSLIRSFLERLLGRAGMMIFRTV